MRERLLSIDQSLTHTACVVWDDGKPVHKVVLRTQSSSAKEKNQGRFLLQQLLSVLTGSANRSDIISTRTALTL